MLSSSRVVGGALVPIVACLVLILAPRLGAQVPKLQDTFKVTVKGFFAETPPLTVALGGDGKLLAVASGDSTVLLWDVPGAKEKARLAGHAKEVICVAFSGDGTLLASGCIDGTVKLWDAGTGKEKASLKREGA